MLETFQEVGFGEGNCESKNVARHWEDDLCHKTSTLGIFLGYFEPRKIIISFEVLLDNLE